jgi:Na+-translocating ferredoxin:NAD+ oxidoreductase RnfD subunit
MKAPGIIADRAVLALVFASIVIAAFEISRSWLSFLYPAVFGFFMRMVGDLPSDNLWWNGDIILAFFSGGTSVTAFILIADPSSGAKSVPGNIIIVVLAAVLGLVFRVFAPALYGGIFAVALINALTPFLYKAERRLLYSATSPGGGS